MAPSSRIRRGGPRAALTSVAGQTSSALLYLLQPGETFGGGVVPDLFGSAFDPDAGIWSRAPRVERRQLSLRRDHAEPLTLRLTDGDVSILDRRTRAAWRSPAGRGPVRLYPSGYLERNDQSLRTIGRDGDSGLGGSGEVAGLDLGVHHPRSGLEFVAGAPLWRSRGFDAGRSSGWGLRLDPRGGWRVQVSHASHASGQAITGRAGDDPLDMALDLKTHVLALAAEADLGGRIVLRGGWRTFGISARNTVTDAPIYDTKPDGDGGTRSVGLRFAATDRHDLVYRYGRADLGAGADIFQGGERFGHLSRLDVEIETHAAGWRWRPGPRRALQVDYSRSHVEAASRLRVESWPFTSLVVDFLGQSRIFRGELDLVIRRLGLSGSFASGRVDARAGLAYFDIEPEARLASWRPVIFGVGVDDLEISELDVENLGLLSVMLDMGVDLDRVRLEVQAQQFVWADADKRETGGADPGDPPDDPTPAPRGGWFGGTWLRAAFRIEY